MYTIFSKIIIIPLLIFTPLMSLMNNSLLFTWMLMEISSMSFIFLLTLNNSSLNKWEAAITYFIIQALPSAILVPLMFFNNSFIHKINLLINCTLVFKIGISPFHSWVPWLMNNLSWINCFMLTTLQKIIPLILLNKFSNFNLLIMLSTLTIFITSIMIIKSSTLKKIMSYSSISNSGWMIFIMNSNFNMMIIFLTIYTMNTLALFSLFNSFNLNLMSDFNKINNSIKWPIKMSLIFLLLSMAGLPPFMGFFLKFLTINTFKINSLFLIIMIIMSLFNLFSYMQICWNIIFTFEPSNKTWINSYKLFKYNYTQLSLIFILLSFWIMSSIFIIY